MEVWKCVMKMKIYGDSELAHYNLQMVITVGFKVNNEHAACFRKWSGQIVKDYTIQGWTMDKERLKKRHMFMGIRRQNLLLNERMRKKNIWD